jgi:hypothetical protein
MPGTLTAAAMKLPRRLIHTGETQRDHADFGIGNLRIGIRFQLLATSHLLLLDRCLICLDTQGSRYSDLIDQRVDFFHPIRSTFKGNGIRRGMKGDAFQTKPKANQHFSQRPIAGMCQRDVHALRRIKVYGGIFVDSDRARIRIVLVSQPALGHELLKCLTRSHFIEPQGDWTLNCRPENR